MADFPVALTNVVPGLTEIQAKHVNNLEAKIGIDGSAVVTSLDFLLKNPASADPGHTHSLASGATDVTATAAELNLLNLSGLTAGWVLRATGVVTAAWAALQEGDLPDLTAYAKLAGRATGQTINGGTAASENLILDSTAHSTKGFVLISPSGGSVGIGTANPSYPVDVRVSANLGLRVISTAVLGSSSGGTASLYANAFPTASDQRLGRFVFGVYDEATSQGAEPAIVAAFSEEAWDYATKRGTYLRFETLAPGTITRSEKMRLTGAGNLCLGTTSFGTNAARALVVGNGTAPSNSPVDAFQIWAADRGGTVGKAGLHLRSEDGTSHVLSDLVGINTLAPTSLLTITGLDTGAATLGSEKVTNGSFATDPAANWTFSGWVWDAVNLEMDITGTTGPVAEVLLDNGGTGYVVGDTFKINGGGADTIITVATVSSGVITGLTITNAGTGYAVAGGQTTTTITGAGSGAIVTINRLADSANTLQQNVSVANGNILIVTYVIKNRTAGELLVTVGGASEHRASRTGTYVQYITATGTGNLIFTPTADFTGSLDDVSVKQLTINNAVVSIKNIDGSTNVELRPTSTAGNVGLGYAALRASTTGGTNVAIGAYTLSYNTTGNTNVAVGYSALTHNTSGYYNAALGNYCLSYNTSGYGNLAMGTYALRSNTIGYYNVAMGYYTMNDNTTGFYNVALGVNSLKANLTGYGNVAIGPNTLYTNLTGVYNMALGFQAGFANQSGSYNVAMGYNALSSNRNGSYNVAIGRETLNAGTSAGYGVAVGYQAGYSNTGGYGVFLGYQAGYYETVASKLFIDNAKRASEADGRVKALIYGVFSSTTANQIVTLNANVGIRTSTFGTSADGVLAIGNGTGPATSPADAVQLWSADRGGSAGKASLHILTEDGTAHVLGDRTSFFTTAPAYPFQVGSLGANNHSSSFGAMMFNTNITADGTYYSHGLRLEYFVNGDADYSYNNAGYNRAMYVYSALRNNAGTLAELTGIYMDYGPYGVGGADLTATVTNMIGIKITGLKSASATVTNGFGLYIIGTKGTTTSYDLYCGTTTAAAYFANNVGIGVVSNGFGSSAAKVLGIANGTAPSTSPADMVQLWSADRAATAGKAGLNIRAEDGSVLFLGDRVGIGLADPGYQLTLYGNATTPQMAIYGPDGAMRFELHIDSTANKVLFDVVGTGHSDAAFHFGDSINNLICFKNLGIGTESFGTSAAQVIGIASGTTPTSAPADMAQLWVTDINATAGKAGLHMMAESGANRLIVVGVLLKTSAGDPTQVHEGLMCINTTDNTVKIYADAGWRTIASGW